MMNLYLILCLDMNVVKILNIVSIIRKISVCSFLPSKIVTIVSQGWVLSEAGEGEEEVEADCDEEAHCSSSRHSHLTVSTVPSAGRAGLMYRLDRLEISPVGGGRGGRARSASQHFLLQTKQKRISVIIFSLFSP